MSAPEISVIIPVKNGGRVFKECLHRVRSTRGASYEILVLDDGSSDDSVETAKKYGCRLVSLPRSLGPSNARNVGAKRAKGSILFFIDSDILIQSDTLFKISEIFRDQKVEAIVGVLSEEIRFDNFASQFKNLWMRHTYIRLPDSVGLFYTSVAAIRREIFLTIGGFDTGYRRPSVEDTEFGQRLSKAGHQVRLQRDLEVEHVKHYSLKALLRTDFYRSSDLVKMTLRGGLKNLFRRNETSVPSSFMASVLSFPAALGGAAAGFFLHQTASFFASIAGVFFIALLLLNLSLLTRIKSRRGLWFSLKSFLFILFDIPVVAAGMVFGAVDYLIGRKY